jgi:D-alanyl-D-alanine carboxypeptidase
VLWGFAVFLGRLRSFALALVVSVGAIVGVVQPVSVAAAEPLPACRYDDVLTSPRDYADWNITLLDTTFALRKDYRPPSLVSTSRAGLNGGGQVRSFVIPDLTEMATAARKAGAGLRVVSAYRSYSYQVWLFQQEVERHGETVAMHSVARPGHSEHQLGVTIDFGAARSSGNVWQQFRYSAAGHWMKANSWRYGWIMSYPRNKTARTCYYSEPWHFRYVGRDMAAAVHDSGLTLREYIWNQTH